jgi:hypothetical protein
VSTSADANPDWLSPTRVWRLTECPASAGPVISKPLTNPGGTQNAGSVAHLALQSWIQDGGYRDADPRNRLARAVETVLADFNGYTPPGWAVTHARLLSRATMLAELLNADANAQVISEKELRDPALALRGTPDVVVLGGGSAAIIDLKTQTLHGESLPPWVIFQLTVYAHLVEQEHGVFPNQVEVFSLNRGRLPVTVTRASVVGALATVAKARAADPSVAYPAPETCRYCRRRFDCGPHWEAAPTWPRADCVQGPVERIERAENSTAAVQVQSATGLIWVSGIPAALVTASVGTHIRLVRLYRPGASDEAATGFRWSASSALTWGASGPTT